MVKTAIAGEDPNWGRILMAVGKAGIDINLQKLQLKFGEYKIFLNGKLHEKYDEKVIAEYMKNETLEITVNISTGTKNFTTYTMDLTKKYIEINADYKLKELEYNLNNYLTFMIKYRLICKNCDLNFESWFNSSLEFERLKKRIF